MKESIKIFALCFVVVIFSMLSFAQNNNNKNKGKSIYTEEEIKQMCGVPVDTIEMKKVLAKQDSMYKDYRSKRGLSKSEAILTIPNWQWAMSKVEDQGTCGSCWVHAATGIVEGQLQILYGARIGDDGIDLDELEISGACNGGFPTQAENFIQTSKMRSEVGSYPNLQGVKWDISSYSTISGITGIKNALVNGPVTACFYVYQDFYDFFNNPYNSTAVYHHSYGSNVGGHAVVIVSYDDNGQYWLCKNSWGNTWADNGYFRIGYGQCAIESWENCVVTVNQSCYAKISPNVISSLTTALNYSYANNEYAYVYSGTNTLTGSTNPIPSTNTLKINSGATINLNSYSITCDGSGKIINNNSTIPFTGQYGYAVVSNSAQSEFIGAYSSIQSAVDKANSTYKYVYVGPGTYSQNVSLKSNMELIGASSDATYIAGTININNCWNAFVQNLKAYYINVSNSSDCNYIVSCQIISSVDANSIYSPGLVRIDNTHFLSSGYYYPGIFTDYGIVLGYNNTIEGRDQAVYGQAGNTIDLVNNTCCNNHFDANMFVGNNLIFYGSRFSRNPEGSTINGLYTNWITWDSWSVCSMAKTVSTQNAMVVESGNASSTDSVRQVYRQVVEEYRAICNSLQTENKKIDFKQHSSEFSDVMADFQNIVDTYPDNHVCVSALSQIIGFLCKQEKYQEAEQLIAEKIADKNYQAMKHDIKMLNMIIAHAKGDYDQALLLLDESMQHAEKDIEKANILYRKAKIFKYDMNDKDKANELFEQIVSKYPDTPIAQMAALQLGIELEKSHEPAVSKAIDIPKTFSLSNYPNPFNPSTTISYQLPNVGTQYIVSLRVYDMLGREVAKLVDGSREAGTYTAIFDGSHLASGIYFARFTATPQDGSKPFNQTMKMQMVK